MVGVTDETQHVPDLVDEDRSFHALRSDQEPAVTTDLLEDWDAVPGDFLDKRARLGVWLDGDPGNWAEEERVYVIYVPGEPEIHGWSTLFCTTGVL